MADSEKHKWSEQEIINLILRIVNQRLANCEFDAPPAKIADVKQSHEYQELERECENYKKENAGLAEEIKKLNKDLENAERDYNKLETEKFNLENELEKSNDKLIEFSKLFALFDHLSSLSDKSANVLKRFINCSSPLELVFSVVNVQNIGNFYEYILYDMNNLSVEVFDAYNRILSFLCDVNQDYILIDCNGAINDNEHIDVHNKHYGKINKVIVNGYKYRSSGNVVKKAVVEVL